MKKFRTLNLAVEFYRGSRGLQLSRALKEQFDRAASSIALNLAEGSGKSLPKDKKRFYTIAFGSLRECQAILTLAELEDSTHWNQLDTLAAHLYRLIETNG